MSFLCRKLFVFTSILFFSFSCSYAQTGYVQTEKIKVSGVTTETQVINLTATDKIVTRMYTDGQGRIIQKITLGGSPTDKDFIQPIVYDQLGRQTKGYLPYTAASSNGNYRPAAIATEQPGFYQNADPLIAKDIAPYQQQVFENSPLQRLLKTGSTGNGFQPDQHYKTYSYRTNNTADAVIKWSTNALNLGAYAAGLLSVSEGTDEDGKQVKVFKDLEGKTLLKRQLAQETINGVLHTYFDTYYVYNEIGAVSHVIPPKAVSLMQQRGNWSLTQTDISNLIFTYSYDYRGRVTQKTIPSKGAVYVVYDPLNRPLLLQDANLRASNQWNYIKYDIKGRAISQGIYTDVVRTNLTAMQAYVNSLNYSGVYFEERTATLATGYYTNTMFPVGNIEPLAYSYYDDYDLDQNGVADYNYLAQGLPGEASASSLVRGMPTMVRKRTVGSGLNNIWLINIIFYDKYGRAIQSQGNNHLNYTAGVITDTKTTVTDFTGTPKLNKVVKVAAGTTTTVQTSFTYDPMYRLKTVDQYYNGSATAKQVAAYTYNELGQLVQKKLSPTAAGGSLQSVDYRYSIQGQLLSINNSKLNNDGGITNADNNDVFGMQVLYDKTDTSLGNTAYFSGRISAVKWMSKDGNNTSSYERGYQYRYDLSDRMTAALYSERATASTGAFNNNVSGFNESGISYDANGNLLTLQRNSSTQGSNSNVQIDNLTYGYSSTNPNQLTTVTDGTGANYTGAGFRVYPGGNAAGSYTYDANGNLKTDPYKGLAFLYNSLNRTDRITVNAGTGQYINYTYDANGVLLRKEAYRTGATTIVTDYSEGFVYDNNNTTFTKRLAYFAMPEGRVRNDNGTLKQEYVITDHQGNARISLQDNGSGTAVVRQENSYYAFGMPLPNSPVGTLSDSNKQLYNGGSEWQNDYGNLPDLQQTYFRNYDAALGRFIGVDPLADRYESLTGYQYAMNNPVMFNDPLGDSTKPLPMENTGGGGGGGGGGNSGWFAAGKRIGPGTGNHWADGIQYGDWSSYGGSQIYQTGLAEGMSDFGGELRDKIFYGKGVSYYIRDGVRGYFIEGERYMSANNSDKKNDGINISQLNVMGDVFVPIGDGANQGGGDESTWSKIWNSPIVRAYIPDVVGINVGFTNVIGLGYGGSAQLIFLTRGKDVGFHATYAPSVRAGIDVGVSATLISGYYVGDARNATLGSLLGWGGDVSGSFAGITGGIWASQRSGLTPSWVGGDIGFTAGPPIGPKFGVSGGISYTKPIF